MPVVAPIDNFYARWRVRRSGAPALREDTPPPERLLQAVWLHQRLRRDQLVTLDGRPVRVLHPGFANWEGGPDFRGAVIQFGRETPCVGDVEVDLRGSGWRAHGHDRNPAFRDVILHVVWEPDKPTALPTLALRAVLDATIGELGAWWEHEPPKTLPEFTRGKCCTPLGPLAPGQIVALLREAALVRLQTKAAQFQVRARQVGWEQTLWEGLFRALGYKHNAWPMQTLAEQRHRWAVPLTGPENLQARLLGLSGLLPTEPSRTKSATDNYLRRVWDIWWRDRDEFEDLIVPRTAWRLHGLRPANHPQRRLALAARWLATGRLSVQLEQWGRGQLPDPALPASLAEILGGGVDEFWSWHWTLRSPRLARPQALLGESRVTDLAVNVILPWLWIRANQADAVALRGEIERRYFAWPAGEDNSILRLARQRLLGGRRLPARKASLQQGLLQIVRDFCQHSNAICADCRFPELIADWQRKG